LKPSFAKQIVSDLSAFSELVDQLMARIPKDGSTFDLQLLITTMYVDSSQQFLVGQAPGVFSGQDATDAPLGSQTYLDAFEASLLGMGLSMITGSLRFLVPRSMTIAPWEKVWAYVDFYVARSLEKKGSAAEAPQRSLLDLVASQTSDRREIRNQVLQGMLAAQDTTSTLISNTVFLLARCPGVWSRLRQELGELGSSPSADALRGVPLLRDVLRECKHFPSLTVLLYRC
jgi:cytochrome P450